VMKRGTDAGWTPITGLAPHWTKVVEKEKEKDDTSRLNTNHAAYKLAPENTRPIQCHFWYQQGEALATATRLKEEADAKTAAEQALADEQLRKNAAAKQEADAVTAKAESRELRKLADERRRLAEVKAKEREAKRAEAEATKQLEATKEVEKGSEEAGVDSDFVILGSKDLIEAEANMERNASSAATTATAADSDGPKVVEMDAGEDEEDNEGGYFFSSREKKGSRWNKSFSSSSGEAGSSSVQPKASEPEEPDYGDLPPSMRPM